MAGNESGPPVPSNSSGGSGNVVSDVMNGVNSGAYNFARSVDPEIYLGTEEVSPTGQRWSGRARRFNRTVTQAVKTSTSQWARRWYELTPEERADYTERFRQAGMSVNSPLQARNAWIGLGELAAEQYANGTGDEMTPDDLLDTLIAEAPVAEEDEDLTPVEKRDLRSKARTELERFAYANGLTLDNDTFKRHVNDILNEETTLATLQKAYMKQITAAYPAFADQIEAGFSLREIAQPYAREMSAILEIPEDAIDLRDPAMAKALQAVGQDGKPTYVPLWQFREELKKDERWQYTDNAWNEMGDAAMGIARMFGLTA